ncbi:hypothetical protein NML43_05295 [Rhodopseudomonas palustris]|jgi:hypothetical protein|uniref:hypothetical protein n=1 Tax=Rhodopseudomonas palustris TaxID=1076 RepID=UPI0020CDB8E8|nr:hypothetical protein [Rhodopseudomonas palustris]MCP9626506.1 hypothetical protein [Rhodopseudomonas palustris]
MKISTLIPLALMASVAASAAVQADETSTKNPTEAHQPMMGNGSQGMMGMMNMMGQMQQMMESCNHMMKSSNERHDKQNAPQQKDGRG